MEKEEQANNGYALLWACTIGKEGEAMRLIQKGTIDLNV